MSARRTTDLQKTAATNNLDVHRFPQSFEVRWARFSARLLETVLGSWRALMAYADSGSGNDFWKFHKCLTCRDNLKLICFLADLLFSLTTLQKKTTEWQLDHCGYWTSKLQKLQDMPLIGGWEDRNSCQRSCWVRRQHVARSTTVDKGKKNWTKQQICYHKSWFHSNPQRHHSNFDEFYGFQIEIRRRPAEQQQQRTRFL